MSLVTGGLISAAFLAHAEPVRNPSFMRSSISGSELPINDACLLTSYDSIEPGRA